MTKKRQLCGNGEDDVRALNDPPPELALPMHKRRKKRRWIGVLMVFIGSFSVAVYTHRPASTQSLGDISGEQWLRLGKKVASKVMNGVDYAATAKDAINATYSALGEHKTTQLISALPVVATDGLAENAQATLETVAQFSQRVRQDVPQMPRQVYHLLNQTETYLHTGGHDIEQARVSFGQVYEAQHQQDFAQVLDDAYAQSMGWWREHWLEFKALVIRKTQGENAG